MRAWLAVLIFFQAAAALTQMSLPVQFVGLDIYVDSGEKPLAAYQIEFWATNGTVKIVGVQGGESPAFKDAPHYDPKAIQRERLIIAAFSTDSADKLPRRKTRVATIHVQVTSDPKPDYMLKLVVAADSQGKKISAEVTFEKGNQP